MIDISSPVHRRLAGLALGALVLTGVLAAMVLDRVRLLRSGREIVLPIRPVDPRDLFKGDYVDLAYDISRIDRGLLKDVPGGRRSRVYVTLEQDPAGAWKAVAAGPALPGRLATGQVAIAGHIERAWLAPPGASAPVLVRYGLERYFVPEGTGTRLEDLARNRSLAALVVLDRHGRAAIKGLVIDGKTVYEEPLL